MGVEFIVYFVLFGIFGVGQEVFWTGVFDAIKTKNPGYGDPKIALIVENIFGIQFNKDDVRRILDKYYKPKHPDGPGDGPSWLTVFGDAKDSYGLLIASGLSLRRFRHIGS